MIKVKSLAFIAVIATIVACTMKNRNLEAIDIVQKSRTRNGSTVESVIASEIISHIPTEWFSSYGKHPDWLSDRIEGDIYEVAFEFVDTKPTGTTTTTDMWRQITLARWKWRVNVKTKTVTPDSEYAETIMSFEK